MCVGFRISGLVTCVFAEAGILAGFHVTAQKWSVGHLLATGYTQPAACSFSPPVLEKPRLATSLFPTVNSHVRYHLNSLKGVMSGIIYRTTIGLLRGILGVYTMAL